MGVARVGERGERSPPPTKISKKLKKGNIRGKLEKIKEKIEKLKENCEKLQKADRNQV